MKRLKIVVADMNRARANMVTQALRGAGYEVIGETAEGEELLLLMTHENPDVVIIDIDSPDRDTLEQVSEISEHNKCPIVMFTHDNRPEQIEAAVDAGVSAYVVDGLSAERVKPVVDVAVARFKKYRSLQEKLDHANQALSDRKYIDRAKGILMKQQGLDEEAAYQKMRKMAMDQHIKVARLARKIIEAAELLG
ncbi:ANTAR domain-containing response regulator [Emcibacter sp.]|uniref:ANTAR domain-containing response regulator n=1 Tax=Emcibacter sp. TaxID=1979954 RepID=UPI003A9150DE